MIPLLNALMYGYQTRDENIPEISFIQSLFKKVLKLQEISEYKIDLYSPVYSNNCLHINGHLSSSVFLLTIIAYQMYRV